jgi:hypothetical protein
VMRATAALPSGLTIARGVPISVSSKTSRCARHRVRRRLDYPAELGLDPRRYAQALGDAYLMILSPDSGPSAKISS